jgi:hypothetical protein
MRRFDNCDNYDDCNYAKVFAMTLVTGMLTTFVILLIIVARQSINNKKYYENTPINKICSNIDNQYECDDRCDDYCYWCGNVKQCYHSNRTDCYIHHVPKMMPPQYICNYNNNFPMIVSFSSISVFLIATLLVLCFVDVYYHVTKKIKHIV